MTKGSLWSKALALLMSLLLVIGIGALPSQALASVAKSDGWIKPVTGDRANETVQSLLPWTNSKILEDLKGIDSTSSDAEVIKAVQKAYRSQYFLGEAAPFSVFQLGDYTVSGADLEGRAAIGGNIDVSPLGWNNTYSMGTQIDDSGATIILDGKIVNNGNQGNSISKTTKGQHKLVLNDSELNASKDELEAEGTLSSTVEDKFNVLKSNNATIDQTATYIASLIDFKDSFKFLKNLSKDAADENSDFEYKGNGNFVYVGSSELDRSIVYASMTKEQFYALYDWGEYFFLNVPKVDGEYPSIVVTIKDASDLNWKPMGNIYISSLNLDAYGNRGDAQNSSETVIIRQTSDQIQSNTKHLLWNVPDAKKIDFNNVTLSGNLLAPNADITSKWGHAYGAMICNSFSGSMERGADTFPAGPGGSGTTDPDEPGDTDDPNQGGEDPEDPDPENPDPESPDPDNPGDADDEGNNVPLEEGLFIEKIHVVVSTAEEDGYSDSSMFENGDVYDLPVGADDNSEEYKDLGFTNLLDEDTDDNDYKKLFDHQPGNTVRYYLKVTNNYPQALDHVVVVDPVKINAIEGSDVQTSFNGIAGNIVNTPLVEGRTQQYVNVQQIGEKDGDVVTFMLSSSWNQSWGDANVDLENILPEGYEFVGAYYGSLNNASVALIADPVSGMLPEADENGAITVTGTGDHSDTSITLGMDETNANLQKVTWSYSIADEDPEEENVVYLKVRVPENADLSGANPSGTTCSFIENIIDDSYLGDYDRDRTNFVKAIFNQDDFGKVESQGSGQGYLRWEIESLPGTDSLYDEDGNELTSADGYAPNVQIVYFDWIIPEDGFDEITLWDNTAYVSTMEELDSKMQELFPEEYAERMGAVSEQSSTVSEVSQYKTMAIGNGAKSVMAIAAADTNDSDFDGFVYQDKSSTEHESLFTNFSWYALTQGMIASNTVQERIDPESVSGDTDNGDPEDPANPEDPEGGNQGNPGNDPTDDPADVPNDGVQVELGVTDSDSGNDDGSQNGNGSGSLSSNASGKGKPYVTGSLLQTGDTLMWMLVGLMALGAAGGAIATIVFLRSRKNGAKDQA